MQSPYWISWQALSQYISVDAEQIIGRERRILAIRIFEIRISKCLARAAASTPPFDL